MKDGKKSANDRDLPAKACIENQPPQPEFSEKDLSNTPEIRKRKKKRAVIFGTVILVLLVVTTALSSVDYNRLFEKIAEKDRTDVVYFPPEYGADIFENEEYMSHVGSDMAVRIRADGIAEYTYPFSDLETARQAFGELENYGYGAGVLGRYFCALLSGCISERELRAFYDLFSEEYENELPISFPPQKIYGIKVEYWGKYEYEDRLTDRWRVSYEIVRNDGTVLNFNDSRDGGEAWFLLEESSEGNYRISVINGIRNRGA